MKISNAAKKLERAGWTGHHFSAGEFFTKPGNPNVIRVFRGLTPDSIAVIWVSRPGDFAGSYFPNITKALRFADKT